ncbi:hypothetical protein ACOME3_001247 [Neoechinorhynchus agilis]
MIAIHMGVGLCKSAALRTRDSKLCDSVCEMAVSLIRKGDSAEEVVTAAITLLENDPRMNAGVGSVLNIDGQVEGDATIMSEDSFGMVGAVPRFKNPSRIALSILKKQREGTLEFGRLVPNFLVGEGALRWAALHKMDECKPDELITKSTQASFKKYREQIDDVLRVSTFKNAKKRRLSDEECKMDTVGAVAIDLKGNMASGVSSGGILLKFPGRIGQAAVYGCGCWTTR